MSAFKNLIERKTRDDSSRLYYLVQYCRGDVQDLVKSCLTMSPTEGYLETKRLLQCTYGQAYKIATAFAERITNGPMLKSEDAESLFKFSIWLTSCKNTLEQVGYFSKVDNPESLRQIIQRLPFDLRKRWRSKADDISENQSREITFNDIVAFVQHEAHTMSHPLFGDITDKPRRLAMFNDNTGSTNKKSSFAIAAAK